MKRMVKIHKGRCYFSLKLGIDDTKSSWGWKSLPICMALLTGLCLPLSFVPRNLDQDFSSIQIGMDSIRPLLSYVVKKWKQNSMLEVSLFSLHLERSFMVKLLSSAIFKWWNFEIITLIQKVAGKTENWIKWQAELKWTPTSSGCLSYGCENRLQRFKNLCMYK